MGRMVAAGSMAELLAEPMTGAPPELLPGVPDIAPEVVPDVALVEATAMEGLPFACTAAGLADALAPGVAAC